MIYDQEVELYVRKGPDLLLRHAFEKSVDNWLKNFSLPLALSDSSRTILDSWSVVILEAMF